MNLKSRRYVIETEYVNGVKNPDGSTAMRPLDDYEKAWLAQFYKEEVNAIKKGALLNDPDDKNAWRAIYKANNDRNNDLYNIMRKTGKLKRMDAKELEEITEEIVKDSAIKYSYLEKTSDTVDDTDDSGD
jgi:flavin-dependent dehydrogenase